MPPRRGRITASGADDDGAHLYGSAARGALDVVEQWSWAQLANGGRGGVDFAERRIHLGGRRTQLGAGRGTNRGLAGAERRVVRGGVCAVSGLAGQGQRRQCRSRHTAPDRRRCLHHRTGGHADHAGVDHQPRGARGTAGHEFLWYQYDSDRGQRGRLCPDVGPGRHDDERLPSGRRHRGRSDAGHRHCAADSEIQPRAQPPTRPSAESMPTTR